MGGPYDPEPQRHTIQPEIRSRDVKAGSRPERNAKRPLDGTCDVRSASAEATASRLATSQEGAVKHQQLLRAGISASAIKRLARAGALHRRHHGVYIVGHLALAPFANEAAALLACGDHAVISHRSALYLWGLLERRPPEVDVTLMSGQCRPKEGIHIHRGGLEPRETRQRHGLPTVSPARAVIDISLTAAVRELEAVIAEGRAQGLIRDGELDKALKRAGNRPGTGRLRAFLRTEGDPGITRSEGERILRRHLKAAGLPQPRTNCKIAGVEPDFLWPDERVIVELDSYPFHGHRKAFEWDRRKDMILRDAGYEVIRITGRQLTEEPLLVIAHIARALDRAARIRG
jgi:very-short-patch-repair endonuclease